ncbi:MAG: RHS repeat-associated core domain-containing protein, partial [Chitinophagales bacterium]|nr:RHS repeat-associated core domain-containing protein [Chitinophagales bacterium]
TRHGDVWQTFRPYTAHLSSLSNKAEVSITQYDLPSTEFEREDFPDGQKNIRNRPAAIRYMEDGTNTTYVVGYSYDALGNIIRAVQYYPVLGISNRRMATKTTDYVYDKLSGQVKRITYQKGSPDQFIHWLSYDINKRLVKVQTSTSEHTPERHRETEARYYYYLHGPLARAEIGHEKIQGVDYAYTIQGWLKGINGYMTGGSFNDIGRDGTREGVMYAAGFAPDIFGEVLNYYPNDYTKISAEVPAFYPESPIGVLNTGFSKPIYNGFIQNSITSLNYSFGSDTRKTFAQAYSYDQAGRLRLSAMLFTNDAGFESAFSPNYRMHIQYDLNGNITRLSRTANSSALIDDLTYIYSQPEENNRLHQITDAGVSSATDLRSQAPNNYRYDNTGRLQSDASEGITEIQYNRQSKITSIRKTDGIIRYHYDAFGRRIAKTAGGETEWYVHDVLGRPLAVYTVAGGTVRWKESVIYGTKRIGLYKPDVVLSPRIITRDSLIRGKRSYELANHTGDVVAVVSDRKILSGTMLSAEIQAAHNYYPFGMTMPGRSIGNETYRYGFQGMQSEDEICGDNNSYTTEFRQYDPRVGRWWSVDPRENKFPSHSPYSAMLNNSILFKDENGAQPNVYRRGAARSRASDDILLSQMLEWGDDPIAGVEIEAEEELRTSKPNDLEMFAIELQRLEGNDDPLAGLPLDEPVNPIVTESRETRRRTSDRVRTVRSDAEILVNEIIMFEDEHVLAIRPAAGSPVAIPSTQAERTSEDYRIVRDAFEQGGVVMDIGGTVNDVVEIIQMARDEGLTIREGAEVLMRGSRNVGGMGLLGGFIGGANMLFEIYDDANALIDGDIGVGTYAGRSALNIIGGAVGCVPVVGAAASWGIEAFRDWALPRPER